MDTILYCTDKNNHVYLVVVEFCVFIVQSDDNF